MPNDPLFLRPTVIAGDTLKDDYEVIHEGRSVGRIMLTTERAQWDWAINPPLPVPAWGHGSERSLDDAKDAFRAAWARFYASLTPESIAHWHHHQDAAETRSRRR